MTAPTISCGCEPLWPSGVDRSGCWWHSADSRSEGRKFEPGVDAHEDAVSASQIHSKHDFGTTRVRGTA